MDTFEKINENKYLMLLPNNESKEKIKKYEELQSKIRDLLRSVTKNSDDYDEKYVKIKFNLGDELPLNKTIEISTTAIVARAISYKTKNIIHKFFQTNVCAKYKMKNKDKLKEIDIKNLACYYYDDIIKDRDTYFVDILLDKKLYENISVYGISYETSLGPKLLRIRFNKIDGLIRVHGDEFRHLVSFDYGLFDKV